MRAGLTLLSISSLVSLSAGSPDLWETEPPTNANHIFNAIHDSMRQWGSSLHHNGVSFFLASVPAGTQLYHGTSASTPVNGTEWLAFEPEHALVFAQPHRGPPPHPPDNDPGHDEDELQRHREELRRREPPGPDGKHRGPLPFEPLDEQETKEGYLHTYAAAKDLRLLYIDGMSAAKTQKGTLDSQDVLLFNNTLDYSLKGPGPGPRGEFERAARACEMAETEWAGRIDGVLRMEAGFEIILCAFERDLTPLRITQVQGQSTGAKGQGGPAHDKHLGPREGDKQRKGPGPGGPPGTDTQHWLRAVTARYAGIGGNRVSINYDHFVTAYSHELDLFPNSGRLPRLAHLASAELDGVRNELSALILTHDSREVSWDWRSTTDMIVTRYSDELSYLASGKFANVEALREYIKTLLSPFIDYSARDAAREAQRCATQFLPVQVQDVQTLPARAVHSVAHGICSTLLGAGAQQELAAAVEKIRTLMQYLDWATWKECRGCEDSEICVVPIWPMGTVADYDKPKCRAVLDPVDHDGESYWGGFHG
ncbi:uncharacterized protein N7459_000465 [Penicillium hispanicum]|uniref:uncharacterized protein n=1 Tax=Penicillium hispanicum TaxID=1080232 RepID=UPI0025401D13|nr:uncharacterized protein N7459_000465 [Penicillium hispanicum]KAJ5594257.1 hypothetical protein N7459_000465 [Penicillium hispanicum]